MIKIGQISCNSQWALAKFYPALCDEEISGLFYLVGVCGRGEDVARACEKLEKRIAEINSYPDNKRTQNMVIEAEYAEKLREKLTSRKWPYYHVNGDNVLPEDFREACEAVAIHSSNTSHLGYILDCLKNGKHVICEKPLVPVLDIKGNPCDNDLRTLEEAVKHAEATILDAEHYSYKAPSNAFYEKVEEWIGERKIVQIEGELKEIDDPLLGRTRDVLSRENRTGNLGDTMCHLISFISNLGGTPIPVRREYDLFQRVMKKKVENVEKEELVEYDVDTYNKLLLGISGERFAREAFAVLTTAKFINFAEKTLKESKCLKFMLDDNSTISIDFCSMVAKRYFNGINQEIYPRNTNRNEYVHILKDCYTSVVNKKNPRNNVRNSFVTLRALVEAYSLPEKNNRRVEFYAS